MNETENTTKKDISKRIIVILAIVILLIDCSGCASKDVRAASKVKYLTDWHVQTEDEEGCYILLFALQDKNSNYVVSPASVELEIINDEGESVYHDICIITVDDYSYWTSPEKSEQYLAPLYIYFDEIEPGQTGKGTLIFNVSYGDSFSFDDISESIHSLPEKQGVDIEQVEIPPNASSDSQTGLASLVGEWRYMGGDINGPEITISQSGGTYYVDIFCMFASGTMCILEKCPLIYDASKSGYIAPYEDSAQGNTGQILISNIDSVYYLTITVESRQYPNSQDLTVINQHIKKINQSEILAVDSASGVSQKEINVFLGNFCEQSFKDFYSSNYSDTQLINFAWTWAQLHQPQEMTYRDGCQYLSSSSIANIIKRYFGLSIINQSTDWITYSNGQYFANASNPATEVPIAIADSVNDNGDGTYTVDFTGYYCTYGAFDESYLSYDSYSANNSPVFQRSGTGKAVVTRSKHNGIAGFNLIEYKQQMNFTGYSGIIQEEIPASYESNKNNIDEVAIIESTFKKTKKSLINDLYGDSAEALYTNTKLIGSEVTYDGNTAIVEITVEHCSNVFDFYGTSTYSFYAKAKFDLASMEMYYFTYQ